MKRGVGVELCTHWGFFERSVILRFKDLTAVTVQEVSTRGLHTMHRRLSCKLSSTHRAGNGLQYVGFATCSPISSKWSIQHVLLEYLSMFCGLAMETGDPRTVAASIRMASEGVKSGAGCR